jgi:hypothetical protein
LRRAIGFLFIVLLVAACQGESPTDPVQTLGPRGRLSGVVTIAPTCATPSICPTTPSDYALRKIVVYNEAHTTLLFTVDVDSTGFYLIDLPVGRYVVELSGLTTDRTTDLPRTIDVIANVVTAVDVKITA